MIYNNVEFDAIVATPGCGKSFLCDKYPNTFVDVDEERLKCKYIVPENITRTELEASKGCRTFQRRASHDDYINNLYIKLDQFIKEGKTLIAAPHPEAIDYLVSRNISFCFVYPSLNSKEEIIARLKKRGNPQITINSNAEMFESFYESNKKENKSAIHYEFTSNEYLEEIIKKFKFKF